MLPAHPACMCYYIGICFIVCLPPDYIGGLRYKCHTRIRLHTLSTHRTAQSPTITYVLQYVRHNVNIYHHDDKERKRDLQRQLESAQLRAYCRSFGWIPQPFSSALEEDLQEQEEPGAPRVNSQKERVEGATQNKRKRWREK